MPQETLSETCTQRVRVMRDLLGLMLFSIEEPTMVTADARSRMATLYMLMVLAQERGVALSDQCKDIYNKLLSIFQEMIESHIRMVQLRRAIPTMDVTSVAKMSNIGQMTDQLVDLTEKCGDDYIRLLANDLDFEKFATMKYEDVVEYWRMTELTVPFK